MTNLRSSIKAKERKRRQRANQRKDGLHCMEFTFTDLEKDALDYLCIHRNPGREPYDRNELVSLLLLCNLDQLKQQYTELGTCQHCNEQIPNHCDGLFKGQSNCWLTRDARQLNLPTVTGHANLEETK